MKIVKVVLGLALMVCLAGAGYYGYSFYNEAKVAESPKQIEFNKMINDYKVPDIKCSVLSLKKSHELYIDTVSIVCEIDSFDGNKLGVLGDTNKIDDIEFIFMEKHIPDGYMWKECLKKIAGSKVQLIMHGKLLKEKTKLYFVPQRIFFVENYDLKQEYLKIKSEAKKADDNKNEKDNS